jgi:hypothetical protein
MVAIGMGGSAAIKDADTIEIRPNGRILSFAKTAPLLLARHSDLES